MPKIFISYRRRDTIDKARNLYRDLKAHFGDSASFFDLEELSLGIEWPAALENAVKEATVTLVLYGGEEWFGKEKFGTRRIDDRTDWVRKEVETALKVARCVIPVVFNGAEIPPDEALPKGLRSLFKRQLCELRSTHWEQDILPLLKEIEKYIPRPAAGKPEPDAPVQDPLPLPEGLYPPPPDPYKSLSWFEEKDARIFFGRRAEIGELYDKLSHPYLRLVLFFGQSGTGKSSLLNAGLLPRLPAEWKVEYKRHTRDGTAANILEKFLEDLPRMPAGAKPLLILDQLEEIFTNPRAGGDAGFEQAPALLHQIFKQWPAARIILGFREEYLARLADLLRKANHHFLPFYLKPLSQTGIEEAISGIPDNRALADCYQSLSLEKPDLPAKIAREILQNESNNAAPLLQFILRSMWDKLSAEPDKAPVYFSEELYRSVRKTSLVDMLNGQLEGMRSQFPVEVDNGLVIDILRFFVTDEITADAVTESEFLEAYRHLPPERLRLICQALQEKYYLMTSFPDNAGNLCYRLCHDAMAPLVLQRYASSDAPGQQASRLLDNARRSSGKVGEEEIMMVLDGEPARRTCDNKEREIIEVSKRLYARTIVKALIRRNRIEEAGQLLKQYFQNRKDPSDYQDLLFELYRFQEIQRLTRQGIITDEDAVAGINDICYRLINLSDKMRAITPYEVRKTLVDEFMGGYFRKSFDILFQYAEENATQALTTEVNILSYGYASNAQNYRTGSIARNEYTRQNVNIAYKLLQAYDSFVEADEVQSIKLTPAYAQFQNDFYKMLLLETAQGKMDTARQEAHNWFQGIVGIQAENHVVLALFYLYAGQEIDPQVFHACLSQLSGEKVGNKNLPAWQDLLQLKPEVMFEQVLQLLTERTFSPVFEALTVYYDRQGEPDNLQTVRQCQTQFIQLRNDRFTYRLEERDFQIGVNRIAQSLRNIILQHLQAAEKDKKIYREIRQVLTQGLFDWAAGYLSLAPQQDKRPEYSAYLKALSVRVFDARLAYVKQAATHKKDPAAFDLNRKNINDQLIQMAIQIFELDEETLNGLPEAKVSLEVFKEIGEYVASGQMEAAFYHLLAWAKSENNLSLTSFTLLLLAKFRQGEQELKSLGLIEFEDYSRLTAQINWALLSAKNPALWQPAPVSPRLPKASPQKRADEAFLVLSETVFQLIAVNEMDKAVEILLKTYDEMEHADEFRIVETQYSLLLGAEKRFLLDVINREAYVKVFQETAVKLIDLHYCFIDFNAQNKPDDNGASRETILSDIKKSIENNAPLREVFDLAEPLNWSASHNNKNILLASAGFQVALKSYNQGLIGTPDYLRETNEALRALYLACSAPNDQPGH